MNTHTSSRTTHARALVRLAALVEAAVAYERKAFDAPPEMDAHVGGADLVDWFSRWRRDAKVALRETRVALVRPVPRRARSVARRRS